MIRITDVSLSYEGSDRPALEDINLTVRPGEALAVVGPSGSGKTTLLKLLNGLVLPTSGRIRVDDLDTASDADVWEIRRRVGLIFQNPDNQLVSTTVERELAFGMENLGLDPAEIARRIDEMLRALRLVDLRHRAPHRLSGGEKQRVAVAAVLAMHPTYLALDEPTSLLDSQGRREVWGILTDLRDDPGRAVIHVTQFPDEVLLSRRAIVIVAGRVVFDGTPQELFSLERDVLAWGLGLPSAVRLAERLRASGYSVPRTALRLDDVVEALASAHPRGAR